MNKNLFNLSNKKNILAHSSANIKSDFKQFITRFFSKKINWFLICVFLLILLLISIINIFWEYSATNQFWFELGLRLTKF